MLETGRTECRRPTANGRGPHISTRVRPHIRGNIPVSTHLAELSLEELTTQFSLKIPTISFSPRGNRSGFPNAVAARLTRSLKSLHLLVFLVRASTWRM